MGSWFTLLMYTSFLVGFAIIFIIRRRDPMAFDRYLPWIFRWSTLHHLIVLGVRKLIRSSRSQGTQKTKTEAAGGTHDHKTPEVPPG